MKHRMILLGVAAGIVAAGLAVRALDSGPTGQHTGTALYAALIYTAVLIVQPRLRPIMAGVLAVTVCWLIELAQLTAWPAALVRQLPLARLVVGEHFDAQDLGWYTVGAAACAALHHLTLTMGRRSTRHTE